MKLEENQNATVRQLVYDKVKYNETYQEVLDHVISSLELERDSNVTFHQKLNQIWVDDFGGYENLPYLEKEREKAVNKQIGRRHLEIFKSYFRFPLVTILLLVSISTFLFSKLITSEALIISMLFVAAVPNLINGFMYFRLKKFSFLKASIKDKKLTKNGSQLLGIFNMLVFFPLVFSSNRQEILGNRFSSTIFLLVFILLIVNSLCYLKLYKETFKMELSK